MKAHWRKLGLLYAPTGSGRHPKLLTHAANPLPVHLEGNVYRIFYSGRDALRRSSVGAVDIDIIRQEIVRDHWAPVFVHGEPGSFFADGVSIGNVYRAGGRRFMLFMGWQVAGLPHWRGEIGRLVVGDDLALSLDGDEPFMRLDETDAVSLSYPWVDHIGGSYRMWYGSTVTWDAGNGEMLHVIKAATSRDGHTWVREGQALPAPIGIAQAFSRPTVAPGPLGGFEMWFSYRNGAGEKYRIGKAVSEDGIRWELALADAGIGVSGQGWDANMVEYPFVWEHAGMQYMLYNGDDYGKTGFGLAVRENR